MARLRHRRGRKSGYARSLSRNPYWDAVAAAFPAGFVNELSDLEAELEGISTRENFARGFRLGARLMLEALGQDT